MKRWIAVGVLIGVGALPIAATQAQQRQGGSGQQGADGRGGGASNRRPVEIEKYRDNVFRIFNTGSNCTAFITDAGVVLIETGNPGYGREILDRLKTVTNKPITMMISTHTHSDHTGSNHELGPAENIEFVAHENTRANLARATCAPVGGCSWFKGEDAKYLPKKTFKDKMSLKSGDLKMELYWFGRAHTNGDIAIVFPSMRLAHVGDLFAWRGVPRVMPDDGGSTHDFPDTLKRAQAAIKNVDTIITGHSAVQTWQDWVDYYEYQRTFVDQITAANKAGKTVDEAVASLRFPEKFKVCNPSNTFVSQRMPFDPNGTCIWRMDQAKSDAQNLYDELKKP